MKISKKHPCYGYRRICAILKRKKILANHKKVYKLYKDLKLAQKPSRKKKYHNISSGIQDQALSINDIWAMDFMSDSIAKGKMRILNIIDIYTRECLLIKISKSFPSQKVVNYLEKIIKNRGAPKSIKLDNGPEYISNILFFWAKEKHIKLSHIRPGRPFENGHIESFNGKFRKEFLNRNVFRSILEAEVMAKKWMLYYNKKRPHSSLQYMTPEEYAKKSRNPLGGSKDLFLPIKDKFYLNKNVEVKKKNRKLSSG